MRTSRFHAPTSSVTLASFLLQLGNGLSSASALFLVAAGLTLIFGVTRIVNFAHGSLYMLGAYLAYAAGAWLASLGLGGVAFWLRRAGGGARGGRDRRAVEVLLLKRLYAAPELLQLTATFALVLIVRDAVLAAFGAEDLLGPRAPGLVGRDRDRSAARSRNTTSSSSSWDPRCWSRSRCSSRARASAS